MLERPYQIKPLRYPERLVPWLRRIHQRLEIRKADCSDWPEVWMPKVESEERLPFAVFLFYSAVDDIVDNMNLILADLEALPHWHWLLPGSPLVRHRLLVRAFFSEYYRFKEQYNMFLSFLSKEAGAGKDWAKEQASAFSTEYRAMIGLRNAMTHANISWPRDQTRMDLLRYADDTGRAVKDIETGELWRWEDELSKQNEKWLPMLRDGACDVVGLFQKLGDAIADCVSPPDGCSRE